MEAEKTKFTDLIQNSEKFILVDFYAEWCSPCHVMAPILNDVASEFSDQLKIIKVDIDKNRSISTLYKIISIPTFILFHKGEVKWRESGVIPAYALKKSLRPALAGIQ